MKTKALVLVALIVLFAASLGYALLREVWREEALLRASISGVVEVDPRLYAVGVADIVKTDRLVLLLVHPETRQPVALRFETPLVPPQTVRIGQADARDGRELSGAYLVVGITDKDGEIFKVTPGEVYGRSAAAIPLGTEQFRLVLSEPFRGSLFNGPSPGLAAGSAAPDSAAESGDPARAHDPRFGIAGTITVSRALQGQAKPTDRLVILLFDVELSRPVAFKIIPHTLLPQRFSISLPPEARPGAKSAYNLRILTDRNNDPFGSTDGELIGRSAQPIPLGTKDLVFELDQPYRR